jgi:hypothetical protein
MEIDVYLCVSKNCCLGLGSAIIDKKLMCKIYIALAGVCGENALWSVVDHETYRSIGLYSR